MAEIMAANNLIGAIVFWSYIVAALGSTALVLRVIYKLPGPSRSTQRNSEQSMFIIFSALALVSFATLSYHMLNVLVSSYVQWAGVQHVILPLQFYGAKGILGPQRTHLLLWEWSTTSTLFQDFAEAIVATSARFTWSYAALNMTFWNMAYMGVVGRAAQIPNLWAFFCLAEILPISFAQSLFYLALLRQSPSQFRVMEISQHWMWGILAVSYDSCLRNAALHQGAAQAGLIRIILFGRTLLLNPLILPIVETTTDTKTAPAPATETSRRFVCASLPWLGVAGVVLWPTTWPIFTASKDWTVTQILDSLNSHPAVSALGYDALLSIFSLLLWQYYAHKNARHMEQDAKMVVS